MNQAQSIAAAVTTAQGPHLLPEAFQSTLIDNLTKAHLSDREPPCLLRAPTGSGKTFMLSQVMDKVTRAKPVIWFWFVPYTNLVIQTLDALKGNAPALAPVLFTDGVNQEPEAGQVLVSTTQGVSRKTWRTAGYNAGGGESARTPAAFVALARSMDLEIGVVVDEAHIALDDATEFGLFVKWLDPKYLAMATATPKSQRINDFLSNAGRSSFESFNISRDDVVKARLNKAYIEAVVYDLSDQIKEVADLKATVIRQAWARSKALEAELQSSGVSNLTPLLLVQVDNGDGTIEEAERLLMRECGVPPQAIGKHSADAPDPVMMGSIANNPSIRALIFKQSAGTGFDAPRAFVLASTKSVNDADFAMQFIGRVMRVAKEIRAVFPSYSDIPGPLNTAYIYLANAEAQLGYQVAVKSAMAVKSSLEGQTEVMDERKTRSGATAFTNRPTSQGVLSHRMGMPGATATNTSSPSSTQTSPGGATPSQGDGATGQTPALAPDDQGTLFGASVVDPIEEDSQAPPPPLPQEAENWDDWVTRLATLGISVYPLQKDLPEVPGFLYSEKRPDAMAMGAITRRAATRLSISPSAQSDALRIARNKHREQERHIDLTQQKKVTNKRVRIMMDRNALAKKAAAVLERLPMIEEEDQVELVKLLAKRMEEPLRAALEDEADEAPSEIEVTRMARFAAHWLVCTQAAALEETLWDGIASHANTVQSEPLPDAVLYASDIGLAPSMKHLYGVMPPTKEQAQELHQVLPFMERDLLTRKEWRLNDRLVSTTVFDFSFAMNNDERRFAEALDRADFVAWWFRNPDQKRFGVRLVRGEHRNNFYPDFVVCVEHVPGETPMQRLVETKHDVKDIRNKGRHTPPKYGEVLFVTNDKDRYYLVSKEGAIGEEVDFSNLSTLYQKLQITAP